MLESVLFHSFLNTLKVIEQLDEYKDAQVCLMLYLLSVLSGKLKQNIM